ncbi:phosphoenolpyruvate hydrolase family protein [Enterococcus sp. DIV0800]|uniref:phosphoenolpyruvate hydrolase family protein n=1 Tax=unclassified Enterococcus TaxID=2608891 RepID=UPI003D2FFEE7
MAVEQFRKKSNNDSHLLGIATATGMTALYGIKSGADFILVLNSGKYRQMGRSSLGGYLPFNNSNLLTMMIGKNEIMPVVPDESIFLGVNATDPLMNQEEIFAYLKKYQYSGVVNYPTVCLFDGQFREALEENSFGFKEEIGFLKEAKKRGFDIIGFVSNQEEALEMAEISPEVICVHLGLTEGGLLGAKRVKSFEAMLNNLSSICTELKNIESKSLIMIYGGIINELTEVRYVYNKFPQISGYIGGSTFERINSEQRLIEQIKSFKKAEVTNNDNLTIQILEGIHNYYDYVDFVKKYIEENYSTPIYISELAELAHVNSSYLSSLFKKKVGMNFTEYLIRFRINKAIELMNTTKLRFNEIALMVGYPNYAQFNKIFRKHMGHSPKTHRESNINTIL